MTRLTKEQIDIAIAWLNNNEGDGIEGPSCRAVADWLDTFSRERELRAAAREGGLPVAVLRRKLAATRAA